LNERLKELRKKLGLSQTEFGERIGAETSTISNIERNERKLTERMLISICHIYNVNETWLRTGEGEMLNPIPTDEIDRLAARYGLHEAAKRAVKIFVELDRRDMDTVLAFVKKLNDEDEQKPALTYEEAEAAYVEAEIKKAEAEARERFRCVQAQAKPAEPTLDEQADAFAALARKQFLREKKQESSTSFANESDVG